jgi:hypothetical protein
MGCKKAQKRFLGSNKIYPEGVLVAAAAGK